jgi:DNA polymerase-3 subunit delta'
MIGQVNNIRFLDTCIQNNKLPRFLLIRGDKGSGKKELVKYIAQKTNYELVFFGNSVEAVRNLINLCYQQTKPIIYVITDCEKLSTQAENALLKVAEEPPTNAYIVLTVNDDSLLPTIKSRGTLISMEEYSYKDKKEFAKSVLDITTGLDEQLELCTTPGEIIDIVNTDYNSISKFCDNIVNNISQANIGSALKITKKISPSYHLIVPSSPHNNKTTVAPNKTGKSNLIEDLATLKGIIRADNPNIINILRILLPTILPIVISALP